jgi:hypothetical protein
MRIFLLSALLISSISLSASDYYKLEWVKRVDQNLYSAKSGMTKVLIETQFCTEMTIGSDATLKYDRYGSDNKIIFEDQSVCDVVKVVTE